jgi:hypothetical protein
LSQLRAWLRAHRSALVADFLRRGLDWNRPPAPWCMHTTKSTSEAWLAVEEFAARDAEKRRKAKEETERPIRAEAAAQRTTDIVERLRGIAAWAGELYGISAAADVIEREFGAVSTTQEGPKTP